MIRVQKTNPIPQGRRPITMNVANLDAFGNPRSADHRAAAKYACEMIDSIATQLKVNIMTAARRGDSFDQTERSVRNAVFQLGKQALELFIQLQGDGDLGPEVTTENAKVLCRSETTTRTTIRSIFGMHCFVSVHDAESGKSRWVALFVLVCPGLSCLQML
jgi:hypothetical protein